MKLEAPSKRYLTGAFPSHSEGTNVEKNFTGLPREALIAVLSHFSYMDERGRVSRKAVDDGVIDFCEHRALWNLKKIGELLKESGLSPQRAAVNQDIDEPDDGEARWVNLGTISTYFSTTANRIGKWLDELGLREEDTKFGSEKATDLGLSTVVEMNAGGNKTRKITMWNLYPTLRTLRDAGHVLDFDYEKLLKGSGKNSDVAVSTLHDKAVAVAKEFVKLFKDKERRRETIPLIDRQSPGVRAEVEKILKQGKGFVTEGFFKKYVK